MQIQLSVFITILGMRVWDHRPLGLFFLVTSPTVMLSTQLVAQRLLYASVISSAAPVVETTLVASPTGLCGLVPYTGSDSDTPDEVSSPEHISPLPAISPFICTDSSEVPDSSDGPPSQRTYVAYRCSLEEQAILIRPGEAIPFGRPYCNPSSHNGASPVDSVPSSTLVMGSLAPTRADLLPPRKSFRDSYSSEASIEKYAEVGPIEIGVDMELGIGDGNDVRDHVKIDPKDVKDDTEEYEADASAGDTVELGIDPMSASIVDDEIVEPAGEDSSNSSGTRDGIVRSFKDIPIDLGDVVRDFYHHMSEVRIDRIVGIETAQSENLKVRAMLDIKRDRVNSLRLHMSLSQEEFRQIRRDRDDARGRLKRLESYLERTFMKCQPTSFKGTEGVVGLISALTWWNSHKRTIGTDAAYALSWR
ncbi:hypothetical protein Tco_0201412 [Tanacetum coccineum]